MHGQMKSRITAWRGKQTLRLQPQKPNAKPPTPNPAPRNATSGCKVPPALRASPCKRLSTKSSASHQPSEREQIFFLTRLVVYHTLLGSGERQYKSRTLKRRFDPALSAGGHTSRGTCPRARVHHAGPFVGVSQSHFFRVVVNIWR